MAEGRIFLVQNIYQDTEQIHEYFQGNNTLNKRLEQKVGLGNEIMSPQ